MRLFFCAAEVMKAPEEDSVALSCFLGGAEILCLEPNVGCPNCGLGP